jgi:hypothetical protein
VTEISITKEQDHRYYPSASQRTSTSHPNPGKRPVIVNNMYYPDLESALNSRSTTSSSQPSNKISSTEKPKRRRRTTTTSPPSPDPDYYEDEETSIKPKPINKK